MKKRHLQQSVLLTLLSGGILGYILYCFFPEHYFKGYPIVPVYFFILNAISITIIDACRKISRSRLLQTYILTKLIRILLSVILMVVYCLIAQKGIKVFLLTFIAMYLVYLVYDTWFFSKFEMKLKKDKRNEIHT